jgi:hypothetical protein
MTGPNGTLLPAHDKTTVSFLEFTVPKLLMGLVNALRINNEVASK